MATADVELLDSTKTVETLKKTVSRRALNRRSFMAAIGAGGAAAGAALVAGRNAVRPSTVSATGPAQSDVLNFALNLEYLEATFYAYVTTGADIPASTGVTQGSGAITSPISAPIVFTGPNAAQITDLFNELYYDELNHVIALRNVLGSLAVRRPALNINPTTTVLNSATAVGIARLLEDVGVTAYAGAAAMLSGSYLQYAAQILAVEGFHAGALRLYEIQNPNYSYVETEGTSTFEAQPTLGSSLLTGVYYNAVFPSVGQTITGGGIAPGATILAMTGFAFTGGTVAGSTSVTVASVTGLAVGQTVAGAGIPLGSTIVAISPTPFVLTLSLPANASASAAALSVLVPTPITGTTSKSTTITAVSSVAGLAVGQVITGAGIPTTPTATTITAISGTTLTISQAATGATTGQALSVGTGTITMSAPAITTYTNANDVYFAGIDPVDVVPYDPGSAALASAGPVGGAGFFATSGVGTVSANTPIATPPGLAFARNTSQVLAILYGGGNIFAIPGSAKGGFFPGSATSAQGLNGLIYTV